MFFLKGLLASELTSWPSPTQETCRISAGFYPTTGVSFQVTLQRVKCKCVQMLCKHVLDDPLSWRHIEFCGPHYIDLIAWYSVLFLGLETKAHILVHSWQKTSVGVWSWTQSESNLPQMDFMLTFFVVFYWINGSRAVIPSWIFIVQGVWTNLSLWQLRLYFTYSNFYSSPFQPVTLGSSYQIYISERGTFQIGEYWG